MLVIRARTPLTHAPNLDTALRAASDVAEPRGARADVSAPPAPHLEGPRPLGAQRVASLFGSNGPRALRLLTVAALFGAAHGQVTTRATTRRLGGAFDPNSESSMTTTALLIAGGLLAVGALVGLVACLQRRFGAPPHPPEPEPPRPPLEVVVIQPDETAAIARPLSAPNPDEVPAPPRAEMPAI